MEGPEIPAFPQVNPWDSARSSNANPENEHSARSTGQRIVTDRTRESFDRQQSLSPTEINSENTDFFDYNISARGPQRSATLPVALQHRNVRQLRFENGAHNVNPRRQSTTDTKFSAPFEETAAWDTKAILSLDGGGIRGYSALLIIKAIMRAIKRKETAWPAGPHDADGPASSSYHPLSSTQVMATDARSLNSDEAHDDPTERSSPWLPCHYFDYIAGTSTGGLIGIMLGRLRMTVDECIADYERLGGEVFGHSRWFHLRSPLLFPRDKYNHKTLERVVQEVVKRRSPKIPKFPGGQNFAFDEARCRTVVISYQQQSKEVTQREGVEQPYLFRTYKNLRTSESPHILDRNPGPAHDIPIWQVARATSAAPTYFKPAKIQGVKYLDGGFGANNPCAEIFEEVRTMNNDTATCTNVILSIGTGRDKKTSRFKSDGAARFWNYLNVARKWASEAEVTHYNMAKRVKDFEGLQYYRLNVEDGLGSMKLDEWKARGRVRTIAGKGIAKMRRFAGANGDAPQTTGPPTGSQPEMSQIGTQPTSAVTTQNGVQGHNGHAGSHPHVASGLSNSSSSHSKDTFIPDFFQPKNKTLESIRTHTAAYLRQPGVQQWIEDIADTLVTGRRNRAKTDPNRWEKACFGAWYQCKIKGCPRGEKEYGLRHSMQKHLSEKHNIMDLDTLEETLNDCKIVVH